MPEVRFGEDGAAGFQRAAGGNRDAEGGAEVIQGGEPLGVDSGLARPAVGETTTPAATNYEENPPSGPMDIGGGVIVPLLNLTPRTALPVLPGYAWANGREEVRLDATGGYAVFKSVMFPVREHRTSD
jgi:hypothetical protein